MTAVTTQPQRHAHSHAPTRDRLRLALGLTLLILLVELAGGLLSHSLALLADAGHVLTDVVALALAWFATAQAERPANARKTYGYHRLGILAALVNAATLIVIVGGIAFEAVQRLRHPTVVTPWLMFVAAGIGLAVNLFIALGLRTGDRTNLNVRAALLHVLGDAGASAGVVLGGLILLLTRWQPIDPLISLGIAVLIAWGAWGILRETVDILMEAAPQGLSVAQIERDLAREPGVNAVHDLHVWTIAGGMYALSAHVQVNDCLVSACDALLERFSVLLRERYAIAHTTIQIECAGCASDDLYCTLEAQAAEAPGHAHAAHARDDAPAPRVRGSAQADTGATPPTAE